MLMGLLIAYQLGQQPHQSWKQTTEHFVQLLLLLFLSALDNKQQSTIVDPFYLISNYHNDNYTTVQWHETNCYENKVHSPLNLFNL